MQSSLRLKLIFLMTLVALLFALIAVGLGAFLGIRFLEGNYVQNIKSHMQLAAMSLESPISRMDYLELQEQADLILGYKGISGIQIVDQNDNLILEKGDLKGETISKEIVQNEERTGLLKISFTKSPLKNGIFFLLGICALFLVLGVPVFVFSVYYLSTKYLKDLSDLTQCISDGSCEKLQNYPGESRRDEIGLLAKTLRHRDDELFAYHKELEEYKNQLEQKVADRTRELKRSKQLSETILNGLPEEIALINRKDFVILDVNSSFLKRYNSTKEDVLGETCYKITHFRDTPCEPPEHTCPITEFEKTGTPQVLEHVHDDEGQAKYFEVSAWPVQSENGEPDRFVHVTRDITEKRRTEELRKDVERIVRHDLKSPLNSVIGFSQFLLSEEDIKDECREFLEYIYDAGNKMLHMVNHSLDLFKMEEGTYELKPEYFDLVPALQKLSKEFSWICDKKSVQLQFLIDGQILDGEKSFYLQAEELNIHTVLANLISNAIEASPENEQVTVEIKSEKQGCLIDVHNTGVIPESIRENFFERYVTQGKEKGTGLGTYSAKLIVLAHGGNIDFSSSEEEGTHVYFSLPVKWS